MEHMEQVIFNHFFNGQLAIFNQHSVDKIEALRLGDGGSLFLVETGALRFEVHGKPIVGRHDFDGFWPFFRGQGTEHD